MGRLTTACNPAPRDVTGPSGPGALTQMHTHLHTNTDMHIHNLNDSKIVTAKRKKKECGKSCIQPKHQNREKEPGEVGRTLIPALERQGQMGLLGV